MRPGPPSGRFFPLQRARTSATIRQSNLRPFDRPVVFGVRFRPGDDDNTTLTLNIMTKQTSQPIVFAAMAGLVAAATGCCCIRAHLPVITQQPADREVGTNKNTTLTVEIKHEHNYRFAWYREWPPTNSSCPPGNVVAIQSDRPGWDSSDLRIQNASTNDEGNYFCVITRVIAEPHPGVQ